MGSQEFEQHWAGELQPPPAGKHMQLEVIESQVSRFEQTDGPQPASLVQPQLHSPAMHSRPLRQVA